MRFQCVSPSGSSLSLGGSSQNPENHQEWLCRLARPSWPPGGFWAKTQNVRKFTQIERRFKHSGHGIIQNNINKTKTCMNNSPYLVSLLPKANPNGFFLYLKVPLLLSVNTQIFSLDHYVLVPSHSPCCQNSRTLCFLTHPQFFQPKK